MPQSTPPASAQALPFRAALVVWALLLLTWAGALMTQQAWAKSLWIWPQAPPLNHVFVSSIGAAIAAPVLWIGVSGEIRAALGGVYNLLLFSAGGAWTLFTDPSFGNDPRVRAYTWIFTGSIPVLTAVGIYARSFPLGANEPLPAIVRWSFAAFSAVLVLVGGALLLGAPHIFPWPLQPTASALYGWVFLGAALYFLHGFLRPTWTNARGQLMGFLAYDLVLLWPYVAHLDKVLPAHRTSLIVYLGVILYSAVLAVWHLTARWAARLPIRPGSA